jgi:hypothetical protein
MVESNATGKSTIAPMQIRILSESSAESDLWTMIWFNVETSSEEKQYSCVVARGYVEQMVRKMWERLSTRQSSTVVSVKRPLLK